MIAYSDWEYFIVKDEFQLYFPEGDYDINLLTEWYQVIPTKAEKISYYGDNIKILKEHFEKFVNFGDIKTKMINDMHTNNFLTIWCLAIYNTEQELVGFAAQEFVQGKPAEKKIRYFDELNGE